MFSLVNVVLKVPRSVWIIIIIIIIAFYTNQSDNANYNQGLDYLSKISVTIDYHAPIKGSYTGSALTIISAPQMSDLEAKNTYLALEHDAITSYADPSVLMFLNRDDNIIHSVGPYNFGIYLQNTDLDLAPIEIDTNEILNKYGNGAKICVIAEITYKKDMSPLALLWGGYPKRSFHDCTELTVTL